MGKIIQRERSVLPACDVPLDLYEKIVKVTADIDGIGGYKIGPALTGRLGYDKVVEITRKYTQKPLIFDGQKWGTDIPDTARSILTPLNESGIDVVILFPQSGPVTEKAWIEAAFEQGLGVIVGGLMSHSKYVRSEGGYLADEAIMEMYLNAAELGVSDFVVPGNRPDDIRKIREILELRGISPTFYAPGFVVQGGSISDAAKVAGNSWHAIVGRGIYGNFEKTGRYFTEDEIINAALKHISKL